MANIRSAIKRIRSSERRRQYNQLHRARARTLVKKARRLIADGQLDEAQTLSQDAASALDRAARMGVIHKNNASRRKSRLMRQFNQAKKGSA